MWTPSGHKLRITCDTQCTEAQLIHRAEAEAGEYAESSQKQVNFTVIYRPQINSKRPQSILIDRSSTDEEG
jgi:hypothetical protein